MDLEEVRSHVTMGNAFAPGEQELDEEDYPPTAYVAEVRRRIARASILWRRGGEDRQQVVRMRCFGKYVRAAREDLDLTRTDLGERISLDRYLLLLIEGGLVFPEEVEEAIDQLAAGLGKNPSELYRAFEYKDHPERREQT